MILELAIKSLRNRKFTSALTVLSIALAVVLLLGVERIRQEARESFASTISGTDLIVGARSSPVHLLLYSVFRIGNATNNVRWDTYRALASRPEVAWTIPLSLGDSHRGFRVLGTTPDYFTHFRYARDRKLELVQGVPFTEAHDAVLGAEVADALGYHLGQSIVIAHGGVRRHRSRCRPRSWRPGPADASRPAHSRLRYRLRLVHWHHSFDYSFLLKQGQVWGRW